MPEKSPNPKPTSNTPTTPTHEQTATKPAFDPSKLPASRAGGTHCTPIDSSYGVLGQDDTFAAEEKKKGFGVSWSEKLKGKIARF